MCSSSTSRTTRTMDDEDGDVGEELAELLHLDLEAVRRILPMPVLEVVVEGPSSMTWFGAGRPLLVLVGLDGETVRVAEPEIRWVGPHSPVLHARGVVELSRDAAKSGIGNALAAATERASAARMSRFSGCRECGQLTPPEWLQSPTLCDSCAERNHGVVH